MNEYSFTHLSDTELAQQLPLLGRQESGVTARLLGAIVEAESRQLHVRAGYPSMSAYLMATLPHLCETEHAAFNRIHAARAAREYRVIFSMVADGRLSLTAVNLLAPYLQPENADRLLKAAAGQTKAQVQSVLARFFPKDDVPVSIESVAPLLSGNHSFQNECAPSSGEEASTPTAAPMTRIAPLSDDGFEVRLTMDRETHDLLCYVQSMLGRTAARHVPAVLRDALRHYARKIEKRKFGASDVARNPRPSSGHARYIQATVRNTVWERDGRQCTYVSPDGHRCECRTRLEFDHIVPFALGGESTIANLRLRCRTHNQYEAERTYGAEFMKNKREAARQVAEEKRAAKMAEDEVIPWLRSLRFSAAEAKAGAQACARIPDAPLEERIRVALARLARAHPEPPRINGIA